MSKVTMTLYEALSKKNIYKDRLSKFNLSSKVLVGYYTKKEGTINGQPVEKAEEIMKANLQEYEALIDNVRALDKAISVANVTNTISIPGYRNGEPVTLVEAIVERQQLDKKLAALNTIGSQIERVKAYVADKNERILDPEYMYSQTSKIIGSSERKGQEDTAAVFNKAMENYKDQNTVRISDPSKLIESDYVNVKTKELREFQEKLHSTLMAANTTIVIEVELAD